MNDFCDCDDPEEEKQDGLFRCKKCGKLTPCSVCYDDDKLTPATAEHFGIYTCDDHYEIAVYVIADTRW